MLRGAAEPSAGPDRALVSDATLDDIDPRTLGEYRRLRALANPRAEELAWSDAELLEGLAAARWTDGRLRSTLAGLVLFGTSAALRRLLPALRIDYIRVPGTQWVDDPENRFQSIDIRKPLMLALPLAEDDHAWLRSLSAEPLSADEAKALIYARETGSVDNAACRSFSDLDTLQASLLLRRLRDRGVLVKQSGGNRTHYLLTRLAALPKTRQGLPWVMIGEATTAEATEQGGKQGGKPAHVPLPGELAARLPSPGRRLGADDLRDLICALCAWRPLRGEELATLLDRDLQYLRNRHLGPMIRSGELVFLYPESPNHALQAYRLPAATETPPQS